MNLWIRSQDKMNLVKVRQISLNYQNNKQIIANYIPDFYPNSGEYYEFLGAYKTKERALEVLNEIQRTIAKNQSLISLMHNFTDLKGNEEAVAQIFKDMIYQMPEN